MGLCMIDSGVEIDCLTETIESTQAIPGKTEYFFSLKKLFSSMKVKARLTQDSFAIDNVPSALQASQISSTKILLTWTMSNANEGQTSEICYQPVYEVDPERTRCIVV